MPDDSSANSAPTTPFGPGPEEPRLSILHLMVAAMCVAVYFSATEVFLGLIRARSSGGLEGPNPALWAAYGIDITDCRMGDDYMGDGGVLIHLSAAVTLMEEAHARISAAWVEAKREEDYDHDNN